MPPLLTIPSYHGVSDAAAAAVAAANTAFISTSMHLLSVTNAKTAAIQITTRKFNSPRGFASSIHRNSPEEERTICIGLGVVLCVVLFPLLGFMAYKLSRGGLALVTKAWKNSTNIKKLRLLRTKNQSTGNLARHHRQQSEEFDFSSSSSNAGSEASVETSSSSAGGPQCRDAGPAPQSRVATGALPEYEETYLPAGIPPAYGSWRPDRTKLRTFEISTPTQAPASRRHSFLSRTRSQRTERTEREPRRERWSTAIWHREGSYFSQIDRLDWEQRRSEAGNVVGQGGGAYPTSLFVVM